MNSLKLKNYKNNYPISLNNKTVHIANIKELYAEAAQVLDNIRGMV